MAARSPARKPIVTLLTSLARSTAGPVLRGMRAMVAMVAAGMMGWICARHTVTIAMVLALIIASPILLRILASVQCGTDWYCHAPRARGDIVKVKNCNLAAVAEMMGAEARGLFGGAA